MKKQYDLAICTAFYAGRYGNCNEQQRLSYFERMLDSATRVDWPADKRIVWVIADDASLLPFPVLPALPIAFDVTRHDTNIGNQQNIVWVCRRGAQLAEWVAYCDNDGLFARDCFTRLFNLIESQPKYRGYSLFNTKYHHPTGIEGSGWVEKASSCEHGFVFRADDWENDGSYVCGLMSACPNAAPPYACLRPSGLQHIGTFGLNGTADDFDSEFCEDGVSTKGVTLARI